MQVPVPDGGAALLGGVLQRGAGRARRLGVPLGQPHCALCAPSLHFACSGFRVQETRAGITAWCAPGTSRTAHSVRPHWALYLAKGYHQCVIRAGTAAPRILCARSAPNCLAGSLMRARSYAEPNSAWSVPRHCRALVVHRSTTALYGMLTHCWHMNVLPGRASAWRHMIYCCMQPWHRQCRRAGHGRHPGVTELGRQGLHRQG